MVRASVLFGLRVRGAVRLGLLRLRLKCVGSAPMRPHGERSSRNGEIAPAPSALESTTHSATWPACPAETRSAPG